MLSEEANYNEPVSGVMGSYLQTLSRVSKKWFLNYKSN
jgi:hypothetical protein